MVNNAGIEGPTAPVDDIELADWRECLEVCLDLHFLCARRAAPVLKAQKSGYRRICPMPVSSASATACPMRRRNGR